MNRSGSDEVKTPITLNSFIKFDKPAPPNRPNNTIKRNNSVNSINKSTSTTIKASTSSDIESSDQDSYTSYADLNAQLMKEIELLNQENSKLTKQLASQDNIKLQIEKNRQKGIHKYLFIFNEISRKSQRIKKNNKD